MADKKTLTFALMDGPYESARSTTAFRLIGIAARRGYDVNVFAYEGAVGLPFANQKAHPNAVHGREADEENHPLPKDWVTALIAETEKNGGTLDWVNCGLCVDERGMAEAVDGVRRDGDRLCVTVFFRGLRHVAGRAALAALGPREK